MNVIRWNDGSKPVFFTDSQTAEISKRYGFNADDFAAGEVEIADDFGIVGWVMRVGGAA